MRFPLRVEDFVMNGYVFLQLLRVFKERQHADALTAISLLAGLAYVTALVIDRRQRKSTNKRGSDDNE